MSAPIAPPPSSQPNPPLVPPDEKFWQHYSPHHEFSLSTALSWVGHAAAIGLLILAARWIGARDNSPPLPLSVLPGLAGGGGEVNGVEGAKGTATASPQENVAEATPKPAPPSTGSKPEDLQAPTQAKPDLPSIKEPDSERLLSNSKEVFLNLAATNARAAKAQDDLRSAINPASKGRGGSGTGGGKGTGTGDKDGSGSGGGGPNANLNIHEKRQLRWTLDMAFPEEDYGVLLRQLNALGAIIILPAPGTQGGFLGIHNLQERPLRAQPQDVSTLDRIYFKDDNPASCAALARMLHIPKPPCCFVFLPQQLEDEMHQMEERFRRRDEKDLTLKDQIIFGVVPGGNRGFKIIVSPDQRGGK